MMKPSDIERIRRTIEFGIVPLVGVMFILWAVAAIAIGRMTFNGRPLSLDDSPRRFFAVVGGAVLIGLLCCGYAAVRWTLARRRRRP